MMAHEKKFAKYCIENLDLHAPDDFQECYAGVSLCAINAIFSINTKYQAALNATDRFCDYFGFKKIGSVDGEIPKVRGQLLTSKVYSHIKDLDYDFLATTVFNNRQRTSTKNGVLKSEAAVRFIKILNDFGVDKFQDIPRILSNDTFESCIKNIPGQKKGVSLRYFFMLAGSKDQVKPDRMIERFIEDSIGYKVKGQEAVDLIVSATEILISKGYFHLNPRHLDNIIWNHQRTLATVIY